MLQRLILLVRSETMFAFFKLLEDPYGGVNRYLQTHVGLTEDDLAIIRRNILP